MIPPPVFLIAGVLVAGLLIAFGIAWWIAERDVTRYAERVVDLEAELVTERADTARLREHVRQLLDERQDRTRLRPHYVPMPVRHNGKRLV